MKVPSENGYRVLCVKCGRGEHDHCTGVAHQIIAEGERPIPCECRCCAPRL